MCLIWIVALVYRRTGIYLITNIVDNAVGASILEQILKAKEVRLLKPLLQLNYSSSLACGRSTSSTIAIGALSPGRLPHLITRT